ncbi:MAG TPA: DUF3857 domain-containing protein [Candidatus Sulfotelmatobacter sp.]|nr:DUF3857 domain-containing protein [Candidatus Sulfotelmatobacter sp.]
MMPRKQTVICVAIILVACFFGWTPPAHSDDWQPINPADLALKDNPAQPGADAMILYRESKISAKNLTSEGDTDTEYIRIKIFTKAGLQYANVQIPYVTGNGNEWVPSGMDNNEVQIVGIGARTIHPDGSITDFHGKVLDKVIESASGYKVRAATFSFPDVQPGCIIEYRYTKVGQPGWMHSETWDVSEDIFTREAHFIFIPYNDYSGYVPYSRIANLPGGAKPKCDIGADHMCIMDVQNIPALVHEPLMPPPYAISARVQWYYLDAGQPLNETPEQFWNRTGKKWAGPLDKFLNKKDVLRAEVARITAPTDSPEAKLRKLYARVQQLRNLDAEPSKTSKEAKAEQIKQNSNVKDVLEHGYGSGWQLNALFIGLARAAGFDASEVWLAPRSVVFFAPAREDPSEVNDEISWVRAGGQEYWLDPASPSYPFGLLPWEESATSGIRVSKQGAEIVNTPVATDATAVVARHADLQIDADGTIHGTIEISFEGQEGAVRRRDGLQKDEAGRKKQIEDEIRDWLPAGASFQLTQLSNWADTDKPLVADGTLRISSFASEIAHRIMFPAEIFSVPEASELTAETRYNALYFHYPYQRQDDLKFELPPGYKVEGLPKDQKTDLKAAVYQISCTQTTNAVEVKRELAINTMMIDKKFYPTVRYFFGMAKSTDAGQAVIENAQTASTP